MRIIAKTGSVAVVPAALLIMPPYAAIMIRRWHGRTDGRARPLDGVLEALSPLLRLAVAVAFIITAAVSFGDPRGRAEIVDGGPDYKSAASMTSSA